MRRLVVSALLLAGLLLSTPVRADPADAVRRLYADFVTAQNAHDFTALRATLADGPEFLWVTNGLSIWGADAAVQRIRGFHAHEVWHITPVDARAVAVTLNAGAAFLHVPLELVVGPRSGPARFRVLVSALCTETPAGWRIAALFTTDANPEQWPS